ncbi:MAG: hypothetical protein ACP5C3_02315 [Methanomicrobiales archaeon]
MKKIGAILIIILILGGFIYISSMNSKVEPLGRLVFVKLANPDLYPGHPHSEVLAGYAQQRGSKCALVVHMAGGSGYSHYDEGNVTILQLAFLDTEADMTTTGIDFSDAIRTFIYGIDDDRYNYRADKIEFDTYEEAMNHIEKLAAEKGQEGPIPMVWHGSVKKGNPNLNPGCGFPLYVEVCWNECGRISAYYYIIKGLLFPYMNSPYASYELQHASEIQYYYVNNLLNYE